MAERELKLIVAENRYQRDVGRGLARLPENVMERLGVEQGDVIEIIGPKPTCAIVMNGFPADHGLDIIRIDGLIRRNAGTSIGEKATVRKAKVKDAKNITIAPVEPLGFKVGDEDIRPQLSDRVVTKDDLIVILASPVASIFEMLMPFSLGEIARSPQTNL